MLSITFRDLIYRFRQFLIAVIGAGVVFAMALLLTGLSNSFRVEVANTVDSVGADAWVLPDRVHRARSPPSAPCRSTRWTRWRRRPAWSRPTRWPSCPTTTTVDGEVRSLRLIGHRLGGPGHAGGGRRAVGRSARARSVADDRLGVDVGEQIDPGGRPSSPSWATTEGLSLLGGIPNVYASVDDVRDIAFQGAPLITTVVTKGTPTEPTRRADRAQLRRGRRPTRCTRWATRSRRSTTRER